MITFNAEAVDILWDDLFGLQLFKFSLFPEEWEEFFQVFSELLGGIDPKQRIAVEVRNAIIAGDDRIKDYKPIRYGSRSYYSFGVVAKVLTQVTGARCSEGRAGRIYKSGFAALQEKKNDLLSGEHRKLFRYLFCDSSRVSFFSFSPISGGALTDSFNSEEKSHALSKFGSEPISTLELSVRADNGLSYHKINTIGDLVRRTERDLLG